jgi:hypothetical protein
MSSKKRRAVARVRAITVALSAVSFVAVLFAPLSALAAAPTISRTPPASVTVGSYYNFQPAAYDRDGDRLTFSIQNKPSWLVFYPDTGRNGRTETAANIRTSSMIDSRVTDGVSTASLPAFSITVRAATTNRAPTISRTPPASVTVGSYYNFQPAAYDPDGNTLTISIQNKPSWLVFIPTPAGSGGRRPPRTSGPIRTSSSA